MGLISILVLGFVLGLKHALDADHLVAVSTVVNEYRNPFRAIWVGVSWGLGHTATLFLVGALLLFLNIRLPESAALSMEFLVGVVLVFLGLQVFWSLRRGKAHLHSHQHQGKAHLHFHAHTESAEHRHHLRRSWNNFAYFLIAGIVLGEHPQNMIRDAARPFFRLKSFVVGTVHGLAGSAALMLLVLASLKSTWAGLAYILIFGFGTLAAMGLVTVFLTLPFSASSRFPDFNRRIQVFAATLGIVFGLVVMYRVGVMQGLLV